ncbi:MAG: hypothetical protein AAF645_13560, partial [Myxococcota bacterium]
MRCALSGVIALGVTLAGACSSSTRSPHAVRSVRSLVAVEPAPSESDLAWPTHVATDVKHVFGNA